MSLCTVDVKRNTNFLDKSLIFIDFSIANNLSNMKTSLQIKGFATFEGHCAQTYPQKKCIKSGYLFISSRRLILIK